MGKEGLSDKTPTHVIVDVGISTIIKERPFIDLSEC